MVMLLKIEVLEYSMYCSYGLWFRVVYNPGSSHFLDPAFVYSSSEVSGELVCWYFCAQRQRELCHQFWDRWFNTEMDSRLHGSDSVLPELEHSQRVFSSVTTWTMKPGKYWAQTAGQRTASCQTGSALWGHMMAGPPYLLHSTTHWSCSFWVSLSAHCCHLVVKMLVAWPEGFDECKWSHK